ncbi:hypothetical protein [Neosynechococcus sphagnicola]|nr:hypothetical protein [Neosynechococcus sphagnicola]
MYPPPVTSPPPLEHPEEIIPSPVLNPMTMEEDDGDWDEVQNAPASHLPLQAPSEEIPSPALNPATVEEDDDEPWI